MARDFNQNRIANARLVSATIDKFGKTFAIQSPWNADGFSNVNVTVEQAPTDIKEYLEGNDDITIFACASNIDKLCEYALASFPNIVDLYLFKTSAIVVLDDDLSYLLDLTKIYVPSDLLSAYISAYPTLFSKFDTIVEDYTLTIPFIGDTTLTSEYVDTVIAMLSSAEKNAITKVVIPTDFTQESADNIAWNYDFSAIVNLDDNIWYGATQYDFSVWTIKGSGTLTSAIVESSIASIPSSKLSGVAKVVIPNTFTLNTSASAGCLDVCDTYLPNVTTLELNQEIQRQDTGVKFYSNFGNSNCKFVNIIFNYSSLPVVTFSDTYIEYFKGNNLLSIPNYSFVRSKLYDIEISNATTLGNSFIQLCPNILNSDLLFENVTTLKGEAFHNNEFKNLYLPKVATAPHRAFYQLTLHGGLFIGSDDCDFQALTSIFNSSITKGIFIKANKFVNYYEKPNLNDWKNTLVGVIDGGSTYTNIKNRGVSMGYPTLTGIDTEANIQALTPTEDVLYLASDTGNLWQYSSGTWTNLFSGYTPSIYSDENCSISISPSNVTTAMTIYFKLTQVV